MSLLNRFYDVQGGQVLVDGTDVRDLTLASLGREIAMVLQEPYLFSGTLLENIRYNKLDATEEDVNAAAKAVDAHDFIMALPLGYQTMIGERGRHPVARSAPVGQLRASAGGRCPYSGAGRGDSQHRQLYRELIQKALVTLLKGRTGLVIAHRLATIRDADNIIVLRAGEVSEQGNHDALIARDGHYAQLYSVNYGSFDDLPTKRG